jgi:hypothetical protein
LEIQLKNLLASWLDLVEIELAAARSEDSLAALGVFDELPPDVEVNLGVPGGREGRLGNLRELSDYLRSKSPL